MYFDFIPCRMAGSPAMIPDRAGPSLRRQSRRTYGGFVRLSFASPYIQCAGRRRILKQQLRNHRLLQQTLNVFEKGATMHRGVYTDFLCKALPMPTEGPSELLSRRRLTWCFHTYAQQDLQGAQALSAAWDTLFTFCRDRYVPRMLRGPRYRQTAH